MPHRIPVPMFGAQTLRRAVRALALAALFALPALAPGMAASPGAAPNAACVPAGAWADGAGTRVEAAAVLRRAAAAPAILLGEQHDKAEHHRWQLHTLVALHALNPDLAVGLEMLPRRLQPVLDRWTAGELGEAEFLARSEWRTVWGFDPGFYLPILHFARLHRLPVVALNVERPLIARAARNGWTTIPEGEREGVGMPAAPSDAYRARLTEILSTHDRAGANAGSPAPAEAARRFIEAQTVWDRAMAERIAETRRATGRAVVAILGEGHAAHRDGVPHQLADLGIADAAVLLPWDADRACADLDGQIADAVFGLGPAADDAAPPPPRLGVRLDPVTAPAEGGAGARVAGVAADGVAAAAGLSAGDVVVMAAGAPVRAPADLTAVVMRQAPGTWLPLTVRRDGAELELVAKFPAAAPPAAEAAR